MTKRIFNSVFLTAITVLLASAVLIIGSLYGYFSVVQKQQLRSQTILAAKGAEDEGISYFTDLDTSAFRVTWIAADGAVIYDSGADSGEMENHIDREEIKAALENGAGESE
ncbi:MAG: PAS domain-containing sensor histidine kinase, partial [Ruminiclostridium sp.]